MDEEPAHPHVIVLEKEDVTAQLGCSGQLDDSPDEALAVLVGRMSLAGEDDLDRTIGVGEDRLEPRYVVEEQRRPLVGGEAAGKADGEPLGMHHVLDRAQVVW